LQLVDETDPTRSAALIERGERLRIEYENRQEFWKRNLPKDTLGDLMTVTSARAAMEFFRLRDEQYVPALRAGERERARSVLQQMNQRYEAHRFAIDEVVRIANERNAAKEREADAVVAQEMRTLVLLASAILIVVGFIAWIAQRTAHALSQKIQLASNVATTVASGDLSTEVPRAPPATTRPASC
jgi:HAMP domain-containing protein